IIDRFVYEGVVDYVYWHYWFDFAIFNLADVLIDISVVLMIYQMLQEKRNGGHDWT
ncbi:signal peptidase II, partial [Helicobacter ganmani]